MEDSTSDGLAVGIDLTEPINDAKRRLRSAQGYISQVILDRARLVKEFEEATKQHEEKLEKLDMHMRGWEHQAAIWQEALDRLNGPTLFDDEVRKVYGPAPDEE